MPEPLYRLTDAWNALMESIDETGEVPPDLEARMDALQGSINERAEACCMAHKNLMAAADALQAEATMFQTRATAKKNAAERVKKYLRDQLDKAQMTRAGGERLAARIQGSAKVLKIEDETAFVTAAKRLFSPSCSLEEFPYDGSVLVGKTYTARIGPWRVEVTPDNERAKTMEVPGCVWEQGKALFIVPGK